MLATKIRMKQGCASSNSLLEIDEIFLSGAQTEKFYSKESIHDYLIKQPGTIKVNISPYPEVIPAISNRNEKYVRSTPNDSVHDNLLRLPRE